MDIITYALSKKIAAHAISGVQSMSVSGQTLTINTKDSGVLTMTFPTPKDGVSVADIDVNANNQIVFTMSDGSEIISGKIPTVKGDKGDAGFSPTITENADNTDKIYKLDIETVDGKFTTPNLKGADGTGGEGASTWSEISEKPFETLSTDFSVEDGELKVVGGTGGGEENKIDSISVNGVNVAIDENKNVDITVPSIEGLTKDADLATVAKSGSYEDLLNKPTIPDITGLATETYVDNKVADYTKTADLADVATSGSYNDLADKPTIPSLDGYAKTSEIPSKVSELENDSNYLSSIPEEYVTGTELEAKGYLTEHQDISGKVDKVDGKSLIADTEIERLASVDNYDDTQIKTQIQAVANGLMDSVGYSADYKTIDIIAKNGVKKSVDVAPIISHASITELSDVDTTNKATGKALVYNATTSKHEYADISGTDEKVKMNASTDAKYLGELLDNVTIANENGELKVKKLDGQEVTITEINYLKGLTMNVMDLVNMFSNGGVKIINTPVATYAELLTIDKSSFIEGISYLVYVLADENHDNAKTTYLVDKDSETPTYFGFADSQRDFTTNPIDLAAEITGKLGIANMDSDAIKALFTVDDTYKTETVTNNAFSTHGAKALYDELLLAIGNKANNGDLTSHKDDTDIHVSTEDRTKWDSAKTHADSAHAPSNAQENVLETVKVNGTALEVSNKAVNVTVPTTVAELTDNANYAKKTDIPTTLPADGGNANTVNNHTIETDVPADAVFTDTIYDDTKVKERIAELDTAVDGNKTLIDNIVADLTANDNTKFRFATDGEGNYGFLKADDSFIPFKKGGNVTIDGVPFEGDVLNLVSETIYTKVSTLPYNFYLGSAVVFNNEIHILGCYENRLAHYKFNGNSWTQVSTLPYDLDRGEAVVFNNEIHILGGYENQLAHYKFNGNTWTSVSELPYNFYLGSAVVFNNEIHILGGGENRLAHYKFNGNSWTQVSTLPYVLYRGEAVVFNNEIHILGGYENQLAHYKFNGNTWTSVSELPYNFYDGSAIVLDDQIHIIGGRNDNALTKHYILYNNKWIQVSILPYAYYNGVAVSFNNKIHLMGTSGNYKYYKNHYSIDKTRYYTA